MKRSTWFLILGGALLTLAIGFNWAMTDTNAGSPTLRVMQINIGDSENMAQIKTSLEGFERTCKTEVPLPITLETLSVKNPDEYLIKRNTLMLSKQAPDIIVTGGLPLEDLGQLGVLLPLEGQLSNENQLKSAFMGDYTVVAGYHLQSIAINKYLLDELAIPYPSPDWSTQDIVSLIHRVKAQRPGAPVFMTRSLYEIYFDAYLGAYMQAALQADIDHFDLTEPAFLKALADLKQELRQLYDLSAVPSQTARQRMIFDPKSQEYQNYINAAMTSLEDGIAVIPNLNAMNTAMLSRIYETNENLLVLPAGNQIETLKFAIRKDSPNLEAAKTFVNAVIGWKAQYSYSIYSKTIRYAQINSDNEARLDAYGAFFAKDTNAVSIRNQVLDQLDRGFYEDIGEMGSSERVLKEELLRTTFNLVFDDALEDPQKMKKELQIVTDRIKLMIKE